LKYLIGLYFLKNFTKKLILGADRAIENLNGRLFRGRTLEVKRWDGHTDYAIEETQAEINNRDAAWAEWLENEEDSDEE